MGPLLGGRWWQLLACWAFMGCAGRAAEAPSVAARRGALPDWAPATTPAPVRSGLAVVVGGGVSLGAYQGGYLYALGEELKRQQVKVPLFVGASAGTINALLLGVEMCRAAVPDPAQSPLSNVWMDASLAQLRQGTSTSPTAVFPQDGVRSIAQTIRSLLTAGIDPHCDFVLAAETSRLRPRPVPIAGNDDVPDMQEPFVLRIAAGPDGYPTIRNYVPDDPLAPHALLPLPVEQGTAEGRATALDLLIELVLASSAFPGAFPQVPLPHCLTEPNHPEMRRGGTTECGSLHVYATTQFVDGGVLDNTPIGLAIRTAQTGLSVDAQGKASWGDPRPAVPPQGLPENLSYLLVDTDNDAYDPLPVRPGGAESFLGFAATFAGSFLGAARGRELYDTLDQYTALHERLTVSQLHPRLASRYLVAFFGFFDTRLRDFDFTGGMYDAARLIGDGRLASLLAGKARRAGAAPQLSGLQATSTSWHKLACLAQAYGAPPPDGKYDRCLPEGARQPSAPWQAVDAKTQEPDFESFVELLQASLDELYSQCLCARTLSERPLSKECDALVGPGAGQDPRPPRIRPEFDLGDGWQQTCRKAPDGPRSRDVVEGDLDYAIRRMAQYGFAGATASDTQGMLRARIGTLADDTIARQPTSDRLLASFAAPPVVDNEFVYTPPENTAHLVSGLATELGWTHGRWLRLTTAVQAKGWSNGFAVTPLAGLDWDMPFSWSSVRVHSFLRAGLQLGNAGPEDSVGASPCWGGFAGHAERCLVGQGGLALTAFDVIRGQAIWEQSSAQAAHLADHLLLELGLQGSWPLGAR